MAFLKRSTASWLRFGDVGAPFDRRATLPDIFNCFRLILGRLPNQEEWRGHAMRAGEDLDGVVASYVNSLEFSNRRLLRQDHMQDLELTELADFKIYTAGADAAVGTYVRADNYEREVTAIFRQILRPDMAVVDLGANIGYFTLLSAALVGANGHVFAFEPNPRNARMLEASRRSNSFTNITISQTAAGPQTGLLVLHRSHSNGTTSTPPADSNDLLGAETVPCIRPDDIIPAGQKINLIKADVEGAEYLALSGCRRIIDRDHPAIVTEFSPSQMPGISGISGPDYLDWLQSLGYRLQVIEADGSLSPVQNADGIMTRYRERGIDHIDILATAASSP